MNKKLLLKVKKAILAHPDQFEMRGWFKSTLDTWDKGGDRMLAGGCGTAACIGGWACHIASGRRKIKGTAFSVMDVEGTAARSLGLEISESGSLFYTDEWPKDLKEKHEEATTPRQIARLAAERIDRFIKEYERDNE